LTASASTNTFDEQPVRAGKPVKFMTAIRLGLHLHPPPQSLDAFVDTVKGADRYGCARLAPATLISRSNITIDILDAVLVEVNSCGRMASVY
jgi:hypothetical protein